MGLAIEADGNSEVMKTTGDLLSVARCFHHIWGLLFA
jgi:hypothetical protein